MAKPLNFVHPGVVERLENGTFVEERQKKKAPPQQGREGVGDRRKLSPLAIIKRCVRYEPNVFRHRRTLLLELIHALNAPEKKIILLAGSQGIGKTSLARALIEPMGGGAEQVLWFEANRHTDFEEISHFLLRTIQELFEKPGGEQPSLSFERRLDRERQRERLQGNPQIPAGDPLIAQLDQLLRTVMDVPLLLVLDNVETLVDANLGFNSAPFKEVLNFLLGFGNIKMILSGERLPYADIVPGQESVVDVRLSGLDDTDAVTWLQDAQEAQRRPANPKPDPGILEQAALGVGQPGETAAIAEASAMVALVEKVGANPWLLKTLIQVHEVTALPYTTLSALLKTQVAPDNSPSPSAEDDWFTDEESVGIEAGNTRSVSLTMIRAIVQLVEERLPDQQRALLYLLAFLRHPANLVSLQAMVGSCFPALIPERLGEEALAAMLDHSLLRCLLKVSYPPQEVLAFVRRSREQKAIGKTDDGEGGAKFKPGYELYHVPKSILYQRVIAPERGRLHTVLRDLYLRERSREAHGRQLRMKNRSLLSEGRFHGDMVATLSREINLEVDAEGQGQPGGLTQPLSRKSGEPSQSGPFRAVPYPTSFATPTLRATLPYSAQLRGGYTDEFASETGKNFPETDRDNFYSEYPESRDSQGLSVYRPSGKTSPVENRQSSRGYLSEEGWPASRPSTGSNTPSEAYLLSNLASEKADKQILIQWSALRERLSSELGASLMKTDGKDGQTKHVSSEEEARAVLLGQALKAALAQRDSVALSKVLLDISRSRSGRGETAIALRLLELALSFRDTLPNEILAELYQLMGSLQKTAYQHNLALKSLNRAVTLAKEIMAGDTPEHINRLWQDRLGRIFQDLAEIYTYRGQRLPALSSALESLHWYQIAGENDMASEIHFQLAGLYEDANQWQEAITHYEKAITWDAANGRPLSAASALCNLGNVYFRKKQLKEAERCFVESMRYDRTGGNTDGELETLSHLVTLYRQQKNWPPAQRGAKQLTAIAIKSGRAFWQANGYVKLGEISEELQDWEDAHQQYRLAKSCGHAELSNESIHWLTQKIREMDKKRSKP